MEGLRILELEKKIKKYEVKMRDLIEAYKCVMKEKETLENTVESLTRQKKIAEVSEGSSELERLQGELTNMSVSIASLTEERRRMERSFLDDKRMMRNEYEANMRAVRAELEGQTKVIAGLLEERESLRESLGRLGASGQQREGQGVALAEECTRLRLVAERADQERLARERAHEARVAVLEESIADISQSLGKMEQQHLCDLDTIARLTDRVDSLIAAAASRQSGRAQTDTPDILQFRDGLEGEGEGEGRAETARRLGRQIWRLQDRLRSLGVDGELSLAARETLCSEECADRERKLREDLEEAVAAAGKRSEASGEREEAVGLAEELRAARDRAAGLQEQLTRLDQADRERERAARDLLARTERRQEAEVARLRGEHARVEAGLQEDLRRLRERTGALLEERQAEIEGLRGRAACEEGPSASGSPLGSSGCPLYQCCEVKARMDQELRRVRGERRRLEAALHRQEAEADQRQRDLLGQVEALQDRLGRAEALGRLSGSAVATEYLRNVFVRLLTTEDGHARRLMAAGVARVLQVPPGDQALVEAALR